MLTLVAKTNVLTYGHDLWWRTFQEVAREYPDVKADYNHVDACCMWMVKNPEHYDVIVTTNMFGDIITDLAAMFQGGMGVAAGGNINPIAAVAAAGMMLDQLGETAAAKAVENAILKVTPTMASMAAGKMGGTTAEIGDRIAAAV